MYGMLQPPPSPSPLHVLYSSSRFISDQFRPSINRLKKDSNTDDIHRRYCRSLRNMWYKHNNPWKSCLLYGLDTAHLTDLVYDHLILKCPCNISALEENLPIHPKAKPRRQPEKANTSQWILNSNQQIYDNK